MRALNFLKYQGRQRLWRITTDVKPIGKYKSIAWLLERILSTENTNAFVFLNADLLVKSDFLSKVNSAIHDNPVLIGNVSPIEDHHNLFTNLHCLKNKIKNRVTVHGRYYASLSNVLEGDLFAIRQDILEKITFSVCDDGFEEYEYSIKLSNANIKIAYAGEVRAYKQFFESLSSLALIDYKKRYKNLLTLKNNFSLLFSKTSLRTKELLLSFLYPSETVFRPVNINVDFHFC